MRRFLKNISRSLSMMLALGLGCFFPQLQPYCADIIRYYLMCMLFMVFMELDLKALSNGGKLVWRVLAANFAMAFATYFILRLFGEDTLADGAFWTCIAPTAVAAPVIMSFLGGKVPFVVTCFFVTNLCIPLSLPLVVTLFRDAAFDWGYFGGVAWNLVRLIGIPMLLVKILQWTGKVDCAALGRRFRKVSFILWNMILFFIAANASAFIRSHNEDGMGRLICAIALVSLVCCALNFSIGYLVGDKAHRHECSQCLGQKNTTMTIYLAMTYAGPIAALGPTFYVFWHNLWNAIQMYFYEKHKNSAR